MLCGLWVSVVNSGAGRRREIQSTRLEARNKLEREMIETHEKRKTKPIFRQEGCYWDLGLPIGDSGQRGRQTNPISAVLAGKRGPRWKTNPIGRNERSAGTARPTGWSPKHGEACGWGLPIRSSGGTGCQTKPIYGVLGGRTGMGRENKANLRIRVCGGNAMRGTAAEVGRRDVVRGARDRSGEPWGFQAGWLGLRWRKDLRRKCSFFSMQRAGRVWIRAVLFSCCLPDGMPGRAGTNVRFCRFYAHAKERWT